MSERRIDETESGSWPTAKAADGRTKGTGGTADRGLDAMARAGLLDPESARPTPASRDWRDDGDCPSAQARKSPCLPAAVTLAKNWVTPQARDGDQRGVQSMRERVAQGHSMSLPEQIKDWTTPTRDDAGGRTTRYAQGGTSLSAQIMWPTATATDAKVSGAAGYSTESGRHSGTTLTDATVGPRGPALRSTTGKNRARLNHRWVAQLMGFPSDWLEGIDVPPSKPSATASSRKSSKPSDEQSEV